jgi:hypothetical protein
MKRVFGTHKYHKSADPITEFGIDAEFRSFNYIETQMGMAFVPLNLDRVRRIISLDPESVNASCSRICGVSPHILNPNPLCAIFSYIGPWDDLELRTTIISLLLLHGADATALTGSTTTVRHMCRKNGWDDVDVLAMALEKANEFRAKLRAIFWVTQQIPTCRDVGEPLIERVHMSTLMADY